MAVTYEYVGKTGGGWDEIIHEPITVMDKTVRTLFTPKNDGVLFFSWSRESNAYLTLGGTKYTEPEDAIIGVRAGVPITWSSDASGSTLTLEVAFCTDLPL